MDSSVSVRARSTKLICVIVSVDHYLLVDVSFAAEAHSAP